MSIEKRRDRRAISFFRGEVQRDKKHFVGYVVNISNSGCAFAHENLKDLVQNEPVRIKIGFPEKVVSIQTIVMWQDQTIIGLRFKNPSQTAKKQIRDYLRHSMLKRFPI